MTHLKDLVQFSSPIKQKICNSAHDLTLSWSNPAISHRPGTGLSDPPPPPDPICPSWALSMTRILPPRSTRHGLSWREEIQTNKCNSRRPVITCRLYHIFGDFFLALLFVGIALEYALQGRLFTSPWHVTLYIKSCIKWEILSGFICQIMRLPDESLPASARAWWILRAGRKNVGFFLFPPPPDIMCP